jgi:hypothetical protein
LLVLLGYINTLCLQLWRRLQLNAWGGCWERILIRRGAGEILSGLREIAWNW